MSGVLPSLNRTTPILAAAEAEYKKINQDSDLRHAFHQAGKRLALIRNALERVNSLFKDPDSPKDAKNSINQCRRKAEKAELVFRHVALAQNNRFGAYNKILAQEGRDYMVEDLVKGMMVDVCALAKHVGIEDQMQGEVEELSDTIDDLNELTPSAPVEENGGHSFTQFGGGNQFNKTGLGEQNNNTGNGAQFNGSSFGKEVAIGGKPEKPQNST